MLLKKLEKITRVILFVFYLFICSTPILSQKINLGLSLGTTFYNGEVNHYTPLINSPSYGSNIFIELPFNLRYTARFSLAYLNLRGDDNLSSFALNKNRAISFESAITEAQLSFSFNFRNYDLHNLKTSSSTPYLSIGFEGIFSDITIKKNNETTNVKGEGSYAIPIVFGIKYRLKPKVGLNFFISISKTFSDDLDGIPKFKGISNANQVGYKSDNDWFTFIGASFLYQLNFSNKGCNLKPVKKGYEYR